MNVVVDDEEQEDVDEDVVDDFFLLLLIQRCVSLRRIKGNSIIREPIIFKL